MLEVEDTRYSSATLKTYQHLQTAVFVIYTLSEMYSLRVTLA